MNKSNLSFFEYYSKYRKDNKESYSAKNFDWQKYNNAWSRHSVMLSHAMTKSTTKTRNYGRGYNLHGMLAKEIKKFMTEWIGVDRLRGGSHVKRLRNKDEINLQPHRRNKINRKLKLTELMNSILYVDKGLKKRSDDLKKRHNEGHKPYGAQYPTNWIESSLGRYRHGGVGDKEGWGKDKRFTIKFHDITPNVHNEIINFLDKITTPVNHHRIFLLPCAFTGITGIMSMKANKGRGYLRQGTGRGMLLIIPEGFCIPWCSYKDLISEHGEGWRKYSFSPPYYNFTYNKGYGTPTFSSQQYNWGMHPKFQSFLKDIITLFSQYSLYPEDELEFENIFKKNDLLNPINHNRWRHPAQRKHIYNVDIMSERFIKSLSHKPFKEFIPQQYDNFYTEIKINDTFNSINYLKGIPLEGKES